MWKAIGPGEVPVAQKFLHCGARTAAVEGQALAFMKYVHHPHLLTTFAIWSQEDLLIVGMELAEQSLWDRLDEVVRDGQRGIARTELIEYMREAARGIDFLNERRHTIAGRPGQSIVHRDIKPQNLLLLGGGVKVADFGLADVIDRSTTTRSGGMTPAYAAPEFFHGQVSRYSDQYSLAVTYYRLRTGSPPFLGNQLQVMAGHLTRSPDLSLLPALERDIVAKGLAKQPQDRWPSCRVFVENLMDCGPPSRTQRGDSVSAWQEASPISTSAAGGRGLAVLRSLARFTDQIWPLVVDETADQPGAKYYSVRDLGPPRAGDRHPIRLGSRVFWSILLDQEADLVLLDEEPEGKVFCLCPSWFVPHTRLRPGRTLLPPEEAGCEPFVVTGIPGREHLFAIVHRQPLGLNWMPTDKRLPARVLSQDDIDRLLDTLQRLQPGSWTVLTTYIDVVV